MWSGCTYTINKGNAEGQPIGTATSKINCVYCGKFSTCKLKKDTKTCRFTPAMDGKYDDRSL